MKRPTPFLLAALALFGLAAWLMLAPEAPRPKRAGVDFPRYPRQHEIERQERRRTLKLPPANPSEPRAAGLDGNAPKVADTPPAAAALDPVQVALPQSSATLVVEAGVLKDSPVGRLLFACLSPEQSAEFDQLEERTGFRPLEQLERIAISGGPLDGTPMMVAEGDFRDVDLGALGRDDAVEPVGARGVLAEQDDTRAMAMWDERILVFGENEDVRAALARLDGETPPAAPDLSSEAYGEIYGTLSSEMLSRLLPDELGGRLRGAADRVLLHVDATDDLLLVAEVHGQEAEALQDLGVLIGGALSLGRLEAARSKDDLLVDLLDQSRVIPGSTSFQLEMALPLETLERRLGECATGAR